MPSSEPSWCRCSFAWMAKAVVLDGEPNAADPEVSLGMGPLIEKGLQHKAA